MRRLRLHHEVMVESSEGALRLLLQFVRAQESGDPFAFRFEPQDYVLLTPGGDSPSARFEWSPEVLADLAALRRPGRDPLMVQRMGQRLHDFIKDAGWARSEIMIAEATEAGRPVYLTIRSSAAEIYALPWELLTLKSGQFIGELDGLLIRFEWPESPSVKEQPQPRPEGGRILCAWSAAAGAVPAAEHITALGAACTAGFHPFDGKADVLAHASLPRLAKLLEEAQRSGQPIAVLHLLCHGVVERGIFGLCLDGEGGKVTVDVAQLRQQLAPFAKMVRLVVLSACDSGNAGVLGSQLGSAAQALHRCGFAAVIASRFPLSVAGSIKFTEIFYNTLLSGPNSIEAALLAARKRLLCDDSELSRAERRLDWASLQLYARHDDGDDSRPVVVRPFRGLLAFQSEHRRFFFGRDAEIAEILGDLQDLIDRQKERFLVVAGASGSGKSSVVLAGAVPKLLEANPALTFLRMRPGSDPEKTLSEVLERRPEKGPVLLVVDQFEEIFTHRASPTARAGFVKRLWSLSAAPDSELRIIITVRVDFIGRCGELTLNEAGLRLDRVAYDEAYRVFIAQLDPAQLRAAILEPLRKVGLVLQEGIADHMLDEVGREPGALPLLQDALDALWQHRDGRTLTQRAYAELGGVVGALRRRANALLDKLSKADLVIAQRLLVSLVAVADETTLDTRLRVPVAELRQGFSDKDGFDKVLGELVAARLLVQDGDRQTSQVEVAHEALIRKWSRLRAWLDEDRTGLIVQRRIKQAAEHWDGHERDVSLLYRGGQLAQALEWRKDWPKERLGKLEAEFLAAGEQQQRLLEQREAARLRNAYLALLGMAILLAGSILAGREAYLRSVEARDRSVEARDALLVSVAEAQSKEDPTLAVTLLREAGHRESPLWQQTAINLLQQGIAETILRESESYVHAIAFSPDGHKLATAENHETVRVFGPDGVTKQIPPLGSYVLSLSFTPDGQVHDPVRETAMGSGEHVGFIVLQSNLHREFLRRRAYSPDGKKLATIEKNGTVRIWNAGGLRATLNGHTDQVLAVAYDALGRRIITGSKDGTARLWDADSAEALTVLKGSGAAVSAVAFSPNGARVVTGSWDGIARIYHTSEHQLRAVLLGHGADIYAVAFSPDGKRVATGSEDGSVRIWKAEGGSLPVRLGPANWVAALTFSPDSRKIAFSIGYEPTQIWSLDGSAPPVILPHPASPYLPLGFSPDGRRLICRENDGTVVSFAIDGSGSPILLAGDRSKSVWTGALEGAFLGTRDLIFWYELSTDGKKVAIPLTDGSISVWDADGSGHRVKVPGLKRESLTNHALSPDGQQILADSGRAIQLFKTDGSKPVTLHKGIAEDVTAMAYSPDGKKVAIGTEGTHVFILNTDATGDPIRLVGHHARIDSVTLSADSKRVAASSHDGNVYVWNADGSGTPLVFAVGVDWIDHLAFSPDGKRLAAGTTRGIHLLTLDKDLLNAALWDATGECVPPMRRRNLLLESPADAQKGHELCQKEVAKHPYWPKAP